MSWQDLQWQESMRIRVNINGMMSEQMGEWGLTKEELLALPLESAAQGMIDKRDQMKWRELPYNQDEIVADILATAAEIQARFENFVVLGIGGSALGPIAVHQALRHLHYNDLPAEKRGGPRLYIEDNVDPERMAALLDVIDVEKTMFNVITKSGSTSETMSQLLIITDILRGKLGQDISSHIIATTDKEKGNLIKIARREGWKTFYVPDGVGGRFSQLCPVGLLAAAVCGIDIRDMLAGAAYMDKLSAEPDIFKNPAYLLAAVQVAAMEKGCNIHVLMPYADSLRFFSDWYAQLWAESLGKQWDNDGNLIHAGQTPVKALGVTDQHSQVQLYTEGPFDKVVTFLGVERYRVTTPIPDGYLDIPDVSFLCGHTQNELIAAEQRATEYAIAKSGHLINTITLPEVNAFTVGQLLYLFEVMTAFAGELLNLNAFDQPGVEEGKNATYALLGKPGFDEKRAELESAPPDLDRYIV
ncbi:MAG: glucose-6-phosphate isomerase [Clostridiales bacterium]|nr:glucose-6-phosphate isomerase [Clostridiales bacterium]